jgi:hypothetical protein
VRTPTSPPRIALAAPGAGSIPAEQTTAVSILDRLLHHATVVIADSESYRMEDAQHRKEAAPPT